jgi:hypothetical protein
MPDNETINSKADSTQPIATPVTVEERKEYSGDVPTMSGGTEVGYWYERYAVRDAGGKLLCEGIRDEAEARHIATCINSHAALAQQVADLQAEVARLRESEFPREREEAARQFARTMHSRLGLDEYRMRALIAEVFTELFNKPL